MKRCYSDGIDAAGRLVESHRRSCGRCLGAAAAVICFRLRSAPWSRHSLDKGPAAGPLFDLGHDPGFHSLLFGRGRGNGCDESWGMTHRTVLVGDDHVIGEDGDAAAADRLLPSNESQTRDRGRRGRARAPTGRPVPRTPAMSRITPSVTRPRLRASLSGRTECRRRCRHP